MKDIVDQPHQHTINGKNESMAFAQLRKRKYVPQFWPNIAAWASRGTATCISMDAEKAWRPAIPERKPATCLRLSKLNPMS